MGKPRFKLYPLLTAIAFIFAFSGPISAQESSDQLSDWMAALADANEADAQRLSRDIERAWGQSGSTALDMLLRRGREAMENDDIEVAIEHFSALTDHAPDFAEGWHMRAVAFFMTERFGPALDDLQQALILNPQHYNALYGLGAMFAEMGDYVRAEKAFSMVLDLHPHHERATQAMDALKRQGIGRTL